MSVASNIPMAPHVWKMERIKKDEPKQEPLFNPASPEIEDKVVVIFTKNVSPIKHDLTPFDNNQFVQRSLKQCYIFCDLRQMKGQEALQSLRILNLLQPCLREGVREILCEGGRILPAHPSPAGEFACS